MGWFDRSSPYESPPPHSWGTSSGFSTLQPAASPGWGNSYDEYIAAQEQRAREEEAARQRAVAEEEAARQAERERVAFERAQMPDANLNLILSAFMPHLLFRKRKFGGLMGLGVGAMSDLVPGLGDYSGLGSLGYRYNLPIAPPRYGPGPFQQAAVDRLNRAIFSREVPTQATWWQRMIGGRRR